MARSFLLLLLAMLSISPTLKAQTEADFARYPVYSGTDLGLTFKDNRAMLRVWAPTAEALTLRLYAQGVGGEPTATYAMAMAEGGTWLYELPAQALGFYTVQATIGGKTLNETADPYAHAVGLNGLRGAILNPTKAMPKGWLKDVRPALKSFTDIILGELHVRDLSMHPQSGIVHKGKYLGFTERGTKGPGGVSTGLDHLAELGLTHIHLLPTNDFASVDEAFPEKKFNWGYDPLHYTVPEGSYATNPADPASRIVEYKQMVQALHSRGLRVVIDVVYNHTADAGRSSFEQLVPGYYYRHAANGHHSNASGCGNEVASERPMVRKLIVESCVYWAEKYRVDGFRFDLMGVLDLETMKQVRTALDGVDKSIFIYGEGWTAGGSTLPDSVRALKQNTHLLPGIAAFSDELRDGVKGHYARHNEGGFASGHPGLEESVKFGIAAAVRHPQIAYGKVNASKAPWAAVPTQCINYVACHDDMVLWDKLAASVPNATEQERIAIDVLANTIVFTAQGVPFLPVGDEFLRSKRGSHNSYNEPDSINQFDWSRKAKYAAVHAFYQKLIALRKAHPALRLASQKELATHLEFLPNMPGGTLAYRLKGNAGGDAWKTITLIFNGNRKAAQVPLAKGSYKVVLQGMAIDEAGLRTLAHKGGALTLEPSTALMLVQ